MTFPVDAVIQNALLSAAHTREIQEKNTASTSAPVTIDGMIETYTETGTVLEN